MKIKIGKLFEAMDKLESKEQTAKLEKLRKFTKENEAKITWK